MAHKTKSEFIGKYLNKNKRLKNHKLPYGLQYLNLLAEVEEEAESKWKNYITPKKNK